MLMPFLYLLRSGRARRYCFRGHVIPAVVVVAAWLWFSGGLRFRTGGIFVARAVLYISAACQMQEEEQPPLWLVAAKGGRRAIKW